jgi:hypothetical protein
MFVISGIMGVLVSGMAYLNRSLREIETQLPDAITGD